MQEKDLRDLHRQTASDPIHLGRRSLPISHKVSFILSHRADESQEEIDGMRDEIAAMALKAKDRQELATLSRSLAEELESKKPASD